MTASGTRTGRKQPQQIAALFDRLAGADDRRRREGSSPITLSYKTRDHSITSSASAGGRSAAEADKGSAWHNYLLPIQRVRDGAINAVAAVHAALIQTK